MTNRCPWRTVRHPLQIVTRKGWRYGRYSIISPRGTVFVIRRCGRGLVAMKRREFQLKDD